MPDYYLLSEVPDSVDEPIYDIRTYKKPEPINLLLPSIHASREDNVLDTASDGEEAVRHLQAACREAGSWPSSEYLDENLTNHCEKTQIPIDHVPAKSGDDFPSSGHYFPSLPGGTTQAVGPVFPRFRPPSWAYDRVPPQVMEAARSLFHARMRRQAMYSEVSRCPTDYELFAAWASLPRSNKMSFVSEVSGSYSPDQPHASSLATQRAVTALIASCPDSCCWPSFQFHRLQAEQRHHPPPLPRHSYHPYNPYHSLHPSRSNHSNKSFKQNYPYHNQPSGIPPNLLPLFNMY